MSGGATIRQPNIGSFLRIALAVVLLSLPPVAFAAAAPEDPEAVVQARMRAVNEHDLAAFLALYADSITVSVFPDQVLTRGKGELRELFAPLFAAGTLQVTVQSLVSSGPFVVVEREFSYGDVTEPGIAVYRVANGLIQQVQFLRDSRRAERMPRRNSRTRDPGRTESP